MNTTEPDTLRMLISEAILSPDFVRAAFGGATRGGPCPWVRVLVRPIDLRGERHLQFSYFDRTKDVTQNIPLPEVAEPLRELLAFMFAGIHLSTRTEELDIRTSKKGKIHVGRKKIAAATPVVPEPHNRIKDVPLPEGRADRLLEILGIATSDGRVKPTMRAKFTQINEFLKHLRHVLNDAELRQLGRPVEILDCGCGSSYLTFAAHHYLNDILGIPARIIGVDANEEVIRKSIARADRLGTAGVSFACERIGTVGAAPDIVLALHACDTATDDAIARAVSAGARLFLGVPCCHHDLNRSLQATGPAAVLAPLLRHGILRQRTADLATDAFRALALRILGYRTDVVEFTSPEHTARNLMIRAVRGLPVGEPAFVREYAEMCRFWGVRPYIERALGESLTPLLAVPEKPPFPNPATDTSAPCPEAYDGMPSR